MVEQYVTAELADRSPILLANQFVYYAENFPRLRFAPDLAVIFGVEPGARDNYKIWEERAVPAVIFEITSKGTRREDQNTKKDLYEKIGVEEYWLFDPRGEWINDQLRGYRLQGETYEPIVGGHCQVLGLNLQPEGRRLACYRADTGEKLLDPQSLATSLRAEQQRVETERQRVQAERQRAESERQRAEAAEQQAQTAEQQAQAAEQQMDLANQEAESERQRADAAQQAVTIAQQQAELERQRADRLAQRLRDLGLDLEG